MKTLTQHIAENKALHQNVNIAESKALHQNVNIAENIAENITEKLLINKNYKSPGINNTIYDAFKKDFQWMSHTNMWGMYENLNNIVALDKVIRKKLNDIIRPLVPNDRSIFVHYVNNKKTTNIFYDMLDLLNKKHDDIDFLYDDYTYALVTRFANITNTSKLIIKIFETNEHVIGIVGPENKSDSTASNTIIIFAYK